MGGQSAKPLPPPPPIRVRPSRPQVALAVQQALLVASSSAGTVSDSPTVLPAELLTLVAAYTVGRAHRALWFHGVNHQAQRPLDLRDNTAPEEEESDKQKPLGGGLYQVERIRHWIAPAVPVAGAAAPAAPDLTWVPPHDRAVTRVQERELNEKGAWRQGFAFAHAFFATPADEGEEYAHNLASHVVRYDRGSVTGAGDGDADDARPLFMTLHGATVVPNNQYEADGTTPREGLALFRVTQSSEYRVWLPGVGLYHGAKGDASDNDHEPSDATRYRHDTSHNISGLAHLKHSDGDVATIADLPVPRRLQMAWHDDPRANANPPLCVVSVPAMKHALFACYDNPRKRMDANNPDDLHLLLDPNADPKNPAKIRAADARRTAYQALPDYVMRQFTRDLKPAPPQDSGFHSIHAPPPATAASAAPAPAAAASAAVGRGDSKGVDGPQNTASCVRLNGAPGVLAASDDLMCPLVPERVSAHSSLVMWRCVIAWGTELWSMGSGGTPTRKQRTETPHMLDSEPMRFCCLTRRWSLPGEITRPPRHMMLRGNAIWCPYPDTQPQRQYLVIGGCETAIMQNYFLEPNTAKPKVVFDAYDRVTNSWRALTDLHINLQSFPLRHIPMGGVYGVHVMITLNDCRELYAVLLVPEADRAGQAPAWPNFPCVWRYALPDDAEYNTPAADIASDTKKPLPKSDDPVFRGKWIPCPSSAPLLHGWYHCRYMHVVAAA